MSAEQKCLSAACKCICLNITTCFRFISAPSTGQTSLTATPSPTHTHTHSHRRMQITQALRWKFQSRNQTAELLPYLTTKSTGDWRLKYWYLSLLTAVIHVCFQAFFSSLFYFHFLPQFKWINKIPPYVDWHLSFGVERLSWNQVINFPALVQPMHSVN